MKESDAGAGGLANPFLASFVGDRRTGQRIRGREGIDGGGFAPFS